MLKNASSILMGDDLNQVFTKPWRGGELRMRLSDKTNSFEVACVWYKKGVLNTRSLKDMEIKYSEEFLTYREAEAAYEKLLKVYTW